MCGVMSVIPADTAQTAETGQDGADPRPRRPSMPMPYLLVIPFSLDVTTATPGTLASAAL